MCIYASKNYGKLPVAIKIQDTKDSMMYKKIFDGTQKLKT